MQARTRGGAIDKKSPSFPDKYFEITGIVYKQSSHF